MGTRYFQPKRTKLSLLIVLLLLSMVGTINNAYAQGSANNDAPRNTSVQEDINEFLGYEDLLFVRYVSLPYDTIMNTNMAAYFVDLGFLMLIFLPLIYLISDRINWLNRLGFILLCTLFLLLSVPSAYLNKEQLSVENAVAALETESSAYTFSDAPLVTLAYQLKKPFINLYTGLYETLSAISGPRDGITYVALFLFLVLFLVLLDQRIRHHDVATRTSIHFLVLYVFLWLLLSSGITWYGLLMIPLLFLFVVIGMTTSTGLPPLTRKILTGLLLGASGIWALVAFAYRFANYDTISPDKAKYTYMAAMAEYQVGRKDENNVFDRTFPQYRTALEYINLEDRSYIYRVGTLMPFFVSKNDRRVVSDNFLDFFRNLNQEFPNKQELARALGAYGFRYIIVDLNLAANDHTQEGSLRNKFEQFRSFLYQNPQLQLIATDRILRAADGSLRLAVFPEANMTVENRGWFAVYQIL
ncbi:hypothetical protein [Flavilitoribacter nigricans]|uniref:Uncharacterized protein n=1 Tax=Flavilitoribacter nigricans (strain ATCC 23147 / DSM 23189 / NBRC 102662 / NCIMB 1420 / SS-2) TaxID=1122177 RepID=A0A2D0NE50_FLAN2|nr:hypothetical protein [Flavilitoribacter nigricans]PHN06459.1 hypothetical protein CRP01_12895 [Flavilitoribacter nigricans DSM 23189 = NBRC 102662]